MCENPECENWDGLDAASAERSAETFSSFPEEPYAEELSTFARGTLLARTAAFAGFDVMEAWAILAPIAQAVEEQLPQTRATVFFRDDELTVEWCDDDFVISLCIWATLEPGVLRVETFLSTDEPLGVSDEELRAHFERTHFSDERHALPLNAEVRESIVAQVITFLTIEHISPEPVTLRSVGSAAERPQSDCKICPDKSGDGSRQPPPGGSWVTPLRGTPAGQQPLLRQG